jgi:predicted ATPase
LCRQLGEQRNLIRVLFGLWASHNVRNELKAAHAAAIELLDLARETPQGQAEILGYRALGTTLLVQGRFADSRATLEKLLNTGRSASSSSPDFPYPFDPWLTGQAYLSIPVLLLGYPDQALTHARQALAGAHQLAHHSTLGLVLFCRCVLGQLLRDRVDLKAHAEALSTLAAECGFAIWLAAAAIFRGWSSAESGKLSDGMAQMRAGLAGYEATGARAYASYLTALLADVHRRAGDAAQGQRLLNAALDRTRGAEAYADEAELHRLQGQLRLCSPCRNLMDAQASFRRALEVACNQKARWLELRAAVDLARLLVEQGECREASDLLRPIHGWFSEGANTADLRDARTLLEELL